MWLCFQHFLSSDTSTGTTFRECEAQKAGSFKATWKVRSLRFYFEFDVQFRSHPDYNKVKKSFQTPLSVDLSFICNLSGKGVLLMMYLVLV